MTRALSATRRVLLLVGRMAVLLWLVGTAASLQAQPLVVTNMPAGYLGTYAQWMFEDGPTLTLADAQSRSAANALVPGTRAVPGFGIGARPVWLHWNVLNPSGQPLPMQLSVGTTWLDKVDVYLVRDGRETARWLTGDERPGAPGIQAAIGFVQTPVFEPGHSELYVRVESIDPMVIAIELVTAQQAQVDRQWLQYAYGFIYGFLLALIAYNGMLFLGLRDSRYFFYSLYLSALICLDLAYTGHGLAYLWTRQPHLQRYLILLLMAAFSSSGLLFASRFLALTEHSPLVVPWLRWGSVTVLMGLVGCAVADLHAVATWLAFGFFGIFTVCMAGLGLLTLRRGHAAGRYFLIAVLCGMVGGFTTMLTVLGLIPYTSFTFHALEMGVILEATLLALALAYQMRQHQSDSLTAQHMASHDPLTGLYNRRAFLERAQPIWSMAGRGERPLSMILLDLDHFKQINDLYGHDAGDKALLQSAQLLAKACRIGDVLARWGGEEFIILLPETDIEQACTFADRLRQQFSAQVLSLGDKSVAITASFGVAQRDSHISLEGLIKAADVALFDAKHAGRNRVVRFTPADLGQL